MKIISWNVNGLRAVIRKDALDFIDNEKPDIFCIQEIKLQSDQIDAVLTRYPHQYWNYAVKKGYAGTAIFSKEKPMGDRYGMGIRKYDQEGRVITLEYPLFFLVNVYTPNAQHELARLDYRMRWDRAFLRYIKGLEKEKPVVFCGDLNVAHEEIDLARPKSNHNNAGFTDQEREGFGRILTSGFLDTFRQFYKDGGHYTWWSYIFNSRAKNIGWRIDYVGISEALKSRLKDAFILDGVMGSDHCPVGVVLDNGIG